jgi:hypothetical protein
LEIKREQVRTAKHCTVDGQIKLGQK